MSGLSRLGSWQKRGPDVTRVSRGAQVVSQDISTLCTHPNFQFKKLFDLFFVNLSETKQGKGESDLCNMIHSSNIYFPPSYLPCAIFMFNVSIKGLSIFQFGESNVSVAATTHSWTQEALIKLSCTLPGATRPFQRNSRTENELYVYYFISFIQTGDEKLKFMKDINKHFSQS